SGWFVIRASQAHSWVEGFVDGYGWRTFDPTPSAVAPQPDTLLTRVNLYLDAAEIFWQDWVVAYDIDRQFLLANRIRAGRSFSPPWSGHWDQWKAAWRASSPPGGAPFTAIVLGIAAWGYLAARFGPNVWSWWRTRRRVSRLWQ